jgi:hypothetical protein
MVSAHEIYPDAHHYDLLPRYFLGGGYLLWHEFQNHHVHFGHHHFRTSIEWPLWTSWLLATVKTVRPNGRDSPAHISRPITLTKPDIRCFQSPLSPPMVQ